jgi:hypothetical protein
MSEKKIASVINFHFLSLRGNLKVPGPSTTFCDLSLTIALCSTLQALYQNIDVLIELSE